MPQTVSLVRGTTSVSGDGTSSVTLFTNSASGIATRVIVNQLTFYINTAPNSSAMTINLYHQSSGGFNSIIGQIANTAGTPPRTEQWSLGNDLQTSAASGTTTPVITGTKYAMGAFSGSSGTDVLSFSADTARIQLSNSGVSYLRQCPQNFWIGPSDILRIKSRWTIPGGKGGSPATVSIGYSFTLITES
jgi:hypothetical protein